MNRIRLLTEEAFRKLSEDELQMLQTLSGASLRIEL